MRVDVDLIEMELAELLLEQEDLVSRLEDGVSESGFHARVAKKLSVDEARAILRAFDANTAKLYAFRRSLADLPEAMRGGSGAISARVERAIRDFEGERDRAGVVVREYEAWLREKGKVFLRGVAKEVVASLLRSNPGWKVDYVDSGSVDEPNVKVTVRDAAGVVQFMLAVGQDARDPGVGTRVWWQEGSGGGWTEGSRVRTTDDTSAVVREVLSRGEAVAVRSWAPVGERAVSSGGEVAAKALSSVGLSVGRPEVKSGPAQLEQWSDVKVRGDDGGFLFLVRVWSTFRSGMSAGWSLDESGGRFEERVPVPGGDVAKVVAGFRKSYEAFREKLLGEAEADLVRAGRQLKRDLLGKQDLWVVEVGDVARVGSGVRLPVVVGARPGKGKHAKPLWSGALEWKFSARADIRWGVVAGTVLVGWYADAAKAAAGLVSAVESEWNAGRESVWRGQAREDEAFLKAVVPAVERALVSVGDGWVVKSEISTDWRFGGKGGNAGLLLRVWDESGGFLFLVGVARNRQDQTAATYVGWSDVNNFTGDSWAKGSTYVRYGDGAAVVPAVATFAEAFLKAHPEHVVADAVVARQVREFLLGVAEVKGLKEPKVERAGSQKWVLTYFRYYGRDKDSSVSISADGVVTWTDRQHGALVRELSDLQGALARLKQYEAQRKQKYVDQEEAWAQRARDLPARVEAAFAALPVLKREMQKVLSLVPGSRPSKASYGRLEVNEGNGVASGHVQLDKDTHGVLVYDPPHYEVKVGWGEDYTRVGPGEMAEVLVRMYREQGGAGPGAEVSDLVARIDALMADVSAEMRRQGLPAKVRSGVGKGRQEWLVGQKGVFLAFVSLQQGQVTGQVMVDVGNWSPSVKYLNEGDLFAHMLDDVRGGPTGPRMEPEDARRERLKSDMAWIVEAKAAAQRLGWEGRFPTIVQDMISDGRSVRDQPAGILPAPAGVPVEDVLDSWPVMFPPKKAETVTSNGRTYEVSVSYKVRNLVYEKGGEKHRFVEALPVKETADSLRRVAPTRVWPADVERVLVVQVVTP